VIVTGDFNAGEDNPAFRRLVADPEPGAANRPAAGARPRLRDTFRDLHPDATDVGTFNGFTGDRSGDKIDAVLASPDWQVLAAAIDRTERDGRYPSDHFPVTATLALPGGDRASGTPPASGR
jgi:endonuclease/exonuclease/phosphatase family metal-dependent hydrolase